MTAEEIKQDYQTIDDDDNSKVNKEGQVVMFQE